jgi:glycerophosphoryl diester phosphodiesterase
MKFPIFASILGASLALAACQPAQTDVTAGLEDKATTTSKPFPNATAERALTRDLPSFFDCVREKGGMLIASHRGGPAIGYPENGLETLQYATDNATIVHEIDVAESRDGVLFLMHDRTLGRTTTGEGMVADTDWEDIARTNLVDMEGTVTDFHPPKLSDVLLWAKANGTIVELNKKPTTSFRNIISHVRAAGAEQNTILITYNDNQAKEVARLAPDLMMTASIRSLEHQKELEAAGVDMTKVIAWMGINDPNPRAFKAIGSRGIETAFGTLGRKGERLDDIYLADGDASEFEDLYLGGLTMLATDEPYIVARELLADDKAMKNCGGK